MSETVRDKINDSEELTHRLEKILENHNCTKNYICLDKTTDELCGVCPLGETSLLECLYKDNNTCKYLYSTGGKALCECAVRIFIQKELG